MGNKLYRPFGFRIKHGSISNFWYFNAIVRCFKGGRWFDVATGNNISLNEIEAIVKKNHPDVVFDRMPDRAGDVKETRANTEPLRLRGWVASTSIIEGINRCFEAE